MSTSTTYKTPEQLTLSRLPTRLEIPGWEDCKYSNRNIQACLVHAFPFLASGTTELASSTGKCLHCWLLLTSMEYAVLSMIFIFNSIGVAVSFVKYLFELFFRCK